MPSMAENWANTPAKVGVPPTPPARRQSSYGQGQLQGKSARNHLEGIYADIANKVVDCPTDRPTDRPKCRVIATTTTASDSSISTSPTC